MVTYHASGLPRITSPAGAVAKYCNEHVCVRLSARVSVCLLSASISTEAHARSVPNFCACCL